MGVYSKIYKNGNLNVYLEKMAPWLLFLYFIWFIVNLQTTRV